jgi:hypothetical protein
MSTLSIPPNKLMLLALLGIGAYWLTSRRAGAATLQGNTVNKNSRAFFQSPATASLRQSGQSTAQAQGNLITAALNALMSPSVTRSPGYVPGYTPDATGEAAAQAYYQANQDMFASNPPTLYQQASGTDLVDEY